MKKQLAIILGMSLATGAALAGDEGEPTDETSMDTTAETLLDTDEATMSFEDLDVNQDSLVSEQEATDTELLDSEAFASADANQDGYLSQTEFDAHSGTSAEGSTGLDTGTESPSEIIDDAGEDQSE